MAEPAFKEIARGIHRWTAAHPEYRPRAERVACFALVDGHALALVDPLLPAPGDLARDAVLAKLDALAGDSTRLDIDITIPYHTRSAEELYERYRSRTDTTIWGHAMVARRLKKSTPLGVVEPGDEVGAGAVAHAIGNPRRYEMPLYFPDHKALAFGDAIVGTPKGLRVWQHDPASKEWYAQRFLPTLEPLLDLVVERVLVTHGPPVTRGGREALRAALAAPAVRMY
jgi:hypothetical protein